MPESIGNRIKRLREEKGWSLRDFEERVGINYSVLNRIELEKRPVKDHELSIIADVFSVATDYIMCKTDNRNGHTLNEEKSLVDDPQLGLWFKEGKKASAANRQRALEFLEFLEREEKDRKPGDKQ